MKLIQTRNEIYAKEYKICITRKFGGPQICIFLIISSGSGRFFA